MGSYFVKTSLRRPAEPAGMLARRIQPDGVWVFSEPLCETQRLPALTAIYLIALMGSRTRQHIERCIFCVKRLLRFSVEGSLAICPRCRTRYIAVPELAPGVSGSKRYCRCLFRLHRAFDSNVMYNIYSTSNRTLVRK